MSKTRVFANACIICVVLLAVIATSFAFVEKPSNQDVLLPTPAFKRITVLTDRQLNESSGLILSQRNENCFWTHNDSGDSARLFLVHRDGRTIARLNIAGVKALDWEAIAFATMDGLPKIIVGDIGGNAMTRKFVSLHVLSEPSFAYDDSKPAKPIEHTATVEMTINVTFEGGVTNYEAMAVDHAGKTVFIIEKALLGGRVYTVPLPSPTRFSNWKIDIQARQIGLVGIPYACACDISLDSRSLVVTNYTLGYLFSRRSIADGKLEDWVDALKREPDVFALPKMRQPEAVCFSTDSQSIFMTSEQLPTPIIEVTLPTATK